MSYGPDTYPTVPSAGQNVIIHTDIIHAYKGKNVRACCSPNLLADVLFLIDEEMRLKTKERRNYLKVIVFYQIKKKHFFNIPKLSDTQYLV